MLLTKEQERAELMVSLTITAQMLCGTLSMLVEVCMQVAYIPFTWLMRRLTSSDPASTCGNRKRHDKLA